MRTNGLLLVLLLAAGCGPAYQARVAAEQSYMAGDFQAALRRLASEPR